MCYWDGTSNLRRELLFYLSHKLKNSYCSGKIQERIDSALSAEEWTLLHRTTEGTPRLEMPLKDHLVQPFLETGASMRSSSMLSSLVLKICSDEDSTTSLARLYSWLIVLTVKHVFLTLRWNLSQFNLYLLPCVFSMYYLVRRAPPSFVAIFKYLSTGMLWWSLPEPSPWRRDLVPTVLPYRALSSSPVLLESLSSLSTSFWKGGDQNWT